MPVAAVLDALVDAGPSISEDLTGMLDLLAETIVAALGFGIAVVNIVRPDGMLEVVSVEGDQEARAILLGTVGSVETWERQLLVSEPWGRLRFADHANAANDTTLLSWVPDIEAVDDPDAWHPEDALFAPLTSSDGSLLGILSVDVPHDGRRPGPSTCRALEAFAVSTALAIEHATLRSRAEASERLYRDLSVRDPLTGLGNRALMRDRLTEALATPATGSLLGLAFVDLDGFKEINDRHSHAAGDAVLTAVADRVRRVVRPEDTVVRWGGDEFLVLLQHLPDEQAGAELGARLAAVVAEPVWFQGRDLRVTASVGLAFRVPGACVGADELVRRADQAMYGVKVTGRDGFAVSGAELHAIA